MIPVFFPNFRGLGFRLHLNGPEGFRKGGDPGDWPRDGEVSRPLHWQVPGIQRQSPIPGVESCHPRQEPAQVISGELETSLSEIHRD